MSERKSRAYRTCERVLKQLIKKYGPTAEIGLPLVTAAIKEIAGHDPRTVRNYLSSLCEFKMLLRQVDSVEGMLQDIQAGTYHLFQLNWKKLADPHQTILNEVQVNEAVDS